MKSGVLPARDRAPWERSLPNVPGEQTRIPVAVLGATGMVGSAFIALLARHPWFRVAEVGASERSAGRALGDALRIDSATIPPDLRELKLSACTPESVTSPIVFSALDSSVAGEVEQEFARHGRLVLTNARNHRMEPDVPLVIPEVNPDHLQLLGRQREVRKWTGSIVANGNCAAIVVALALAPLHEAARLRSVMVTTMQALSGAGYPGVASLDILGNVIPYIGGDEEQKIEQETRKILGSHDEYGVQPSDFEVSAQVNRVPVEHGHTACLTIGLDRRVSPEDAREIISSWVPATAGLDLPSAPERAVVVMSDEDRPQPRRDAGTGNGMTVSVGRIRADSVLDLRMVACGHNTIRGAAGASILNAELLVARRRSL
ncbi:MAG TPA: aspartate-semialdehyde dehydrogenase [Gemmatimonadales bacterium]|nr:aspartate-semialdehyde dehydrogenase [Gemmatimonadales bacterium]